MPLSKGCWQRTSLGLLHRVGVLLASVSSETSDLHVDLRASALWGNVCVGFGNGWGGMGESEMNEEGMGWGA